MGGAPYSVNLDEVKEELARAEFSEIEVIEFSRNAVLISAQRNELTIQDVSADGILS
jgi:hypothetical protein